MSVPLIPTPLDQFGQRHFSFYPAIVNLEHNEWVVRRITSSDVQVMNTKTSLEIWVSRHLLGEVSLIEEPVMIVGLLKELEYRAGAVLPRVRRVIEMPLAVNDAFRPRFRAVEPARPAPVIGIRVESGGSRRLRAAIAGGILACVAVAIILRDGGLSAAQDIRLPLLIGADRDNPCHIGALDRYGRIKHPR